jgi:hypothetical protein
MDGQSRVSFSGIFSLSFVVQSGVPQGSVLGLLHFNAFINDLCDVINNFNSFLLSVDLKIYRAITSPSDCLLLQSDIDCV